MYCFICILDVDEEYRDKLYKHEEENVSSDESIASLYEYDHDDNDQSMGDGNDLEMENNKKNNTNVTYTGNDLQLPLVELVDESMVKKGLMSQKCGNKQTMDGMDGMVAEGMATVTMNETLPNKSLLSIICRLDIIQIKTM